MGGVVKNVLKPVTSLLSGAIGGSGSPFTKSFASAMQAVQSTVPVVSAMQQVATAPPPAVPSVAQTQAAARPRAAAAPLGTTEGQRRRRRSSARVSTVLSDLNEDRLGG